MAFFLWRFGGHGKNGMDCDGYGKLLDSSVMPSLYDIPSLVFGTDVVKHNM